MCLKKKKRKEKERKKEKSLKCEKSIIGTQNRIFGWNTRNEAVEGTLNARCLQEVMDFVKTFPRKEVEVNFVVIDGMKGNQERLEAGKPVGTRLRDRF